VVGAVVGDRVAGLALLALDCLGLGKCSAGPSHSIDGTSQVDCGRPGPGEGRAGSLQRGRIACHLQRHAVGGGDADQRRAANGEPPDRIGDLLGALETQPLLAPGELTLVERYKRVAAELERFELGGDGRGYSPES
jgi:hypothetical protein